MLLKTVLITICATLLLATVGCAGPPEIQEVEVAREVPVTVEVDKTVEVTREVPVTQEVPVTVVVTEPVEVTREVEVPQTVEVTREVPVTRVAVATPTPVVDPAVTPADSPIATPSSTPTPTEEPTTTASTPIPDPTAVMPVTPTPIPSTEKPSPFAGWTVETARYGTNEFVMMRIEAVSHAALPKPPVLTYQCDYRGRRALYIDWHHPVVTGEPGVGRHLEDPFAEFRNDRLEALLEYSDDLIEFTGTLRLDNREQQELDDLWELVRKRWLYREDTPVTPDSLVEHAKSLTYGQAVVHLDIYLENTDPDKRSPYGPPILETISGNWFVFHDHTRMNAGSIGEIRQAHRNAFSDQFPVLNTVPAITATVIAPAQPQEIMAKWHIGDLLKVMKHCDLVAR